MSQILVVDDERSMREFLEILLTKEGEAVRTARNAAEALERIEQQLPELVITDLRMKGGSGLDLLRRVKQQHPEVEFLVITAFGTDDTAVEALKMGAYDYVTKPFQVDELKVVVQRALERQRLLRENVFMRAELSSRYDFGNLVGKGPRMQEVYRLIEQVAPTRANVLITGESGTGKELVARALHFRSERRDHPFVAIDCGSIPETLMESELFGHAKGAFTGATSDRRGLFELAAGGTAFLDEVGEVPLGLQVKLLRVLQERSLKRLGDGRDRPVDVRLVAATNRDLEQLVAAGGFRQDLFFRLNVIRIHLPPLRQRREDIAELVRHFVAKICKQEQCPAPVVLGEALEALQAYDFPGNVRELENMVERAVALAGNRPIGPELFTEHMERGPTPGDGAGPVQQRLLDEGVELDAVLAGVERQLIEQALQRSGGVKKDAARLLGITFRSLRYRLAKLGMD
jgi:two-component system response regulator PilR (NtrC family)